MSDAFFENPILNSPYEYPGRHWELDENRQPTGEVKEYRREAEFCRVAEKVAGKSEAMISAQATPEAVK